MVYSLISVINSLVSLYEWLIVIWCVLSWIPIRGGILADIAQVIDRLVSPFIGLFRNLLPPLAGIDFSPIVAFFVLRLLNNVVVRVLVMLF